MAEFLGTAFLLMAVVGSGIMADTLSSGNVSLALLENTIATGAALVALILTFGPISGAHFNPAVTLADATQGGLPWRLVPGYMIAQFAGAIAGVYAAHAMFWTETTANFDSRTLWRATVIQRVHCDIWIACGDLGLFTRAACGCPICRGGIHYRRLLVHGIDVICQSRGDSCPRLYQYICRYPAHGHTRIYCGPDCWSPGRNRTLPLACSSKRSFCPGSSGTAP